MTANDSKWPLGNVRICAGKFNTLLGGLIQHVVKGENIELVGTQINITD